MKRTFGIFGRMSGASGREPVHDYPEDSEEPAASWLRRAAALRRQGDIAGAEAALRNALERDPTRLDAHLELGRLLQQDGRWDEALPLFSRALMLIDPRLRAAARALDRLTGDAASRADRARDDRDWPEAARNYRLALDKDPENAGLWVQYGHSVKEQGNYIEAEVAYRRAIALAPAVADTHLQLGGLLLLRGRHTQAVESLRHAVRLDPELEPARRALDAALGYSEAAGAPTTGLPPYSPAERYGPAFAEASRKTGGGADIIWFGVVDWHYRMQRPQQLAMGLADNGARVFYISLAFESADEKGRFRILESPHPGVFVTRLRLSGDAGESVFRGLSGSALDEVQLALDDLVAVMGICAPVAMVEQPGWYGAACGIAGATVVYDCLDLATGFGNAPGWLAETESALLADADLVIAASQPLADLVAPRRASVVIRNAAEFEHFAAAFSDRAAGERPVIGYFGALADWFEYGWIADCAAARPDWDFRLIGRPEGSGVSRLAGLPNVRLLGERPYSELPAQLAGFDVAAIPFKLTELTRCTNPVKLYEYMAAGKAVVASPLPEISEATDLAYIADDAASFGERIAQALAEDSPTLRTQRRDWAREHTWANRARDLAAAIDMTAPPVSIVLHVDGNRQGAAACLSSIRTWSDYPKLEILVIDGGSADQTLGRGDPRVRVLTPPREAGYAAAVNIGLRAAAGDYVVLLGEDAVVTRGWLWDLIRPLRLDPGIGLCGPLTNAGDNAQLVPVPYRSLDEMRDWAPRLVRSRLRRIAETDRLSFFCIAIRRRLVEIVGALDEAYQLGFFAAEDYCRRAREANYRLAIAEDVFVHHDGAHSFARLGERDPEQMRQEQAIFEQRWVQWHAPAGDESPRT